MAEMRTLLSCVLNILFLIIYVLLESGGSIRQDEEFPNCPPSPWRVPSYIKVLYRFCPPPHSEAVLRDVIWRHKITGFLEKDGKHNVLLLFASLEDFIWEQTWTSPLHKTFLSAASFNFSSKAEEPVENERGMHSLTQFHLQPLLSSPARNPSEFYKWSWNQRNCCSIRLWNSGLINECDSLYRALVFIIPYHWVGSNLVTEIIGLWDIWSNSVWKISCCCLFIRMTKEERMLWTFCGKYFFYIPSSRQLQLYHCFIVSIL